MKVGLLQAPPPLVFGEGDDAFTLFVRPVRDADRMDVIDGINSASFRMISETARGIVVGWENVFDLNGKQVAFDYMDDNNRPANRMDQLLGAVSLRVHVNVLSGLLAYMGFDQGMTKSLFSGVVKGEFDTSPTSPPDSDTTENVSGG